MAVVSDTSPLRYLIVIEHVHLIQEIFTDVLIPPAVESELVDAAAPATVRNWILQRPSWIQIRVPQNPDPHLLSLLDRGEAQAIQLAIDLGAEFLLIDEFRGREVATAQGIRVIGVLGILLEAYRRRRILEPLKLLADLAENRFRISPRLSRAFEEETRLIASSHER